MRFDSADSWSTSEVPSPGGFDIQSVGAHERGHFIGISHSTLGDFTAINPMSATMLPFAAPGDSTFRTLEEDDKASVLRTYARNRDAGPIPQTVGGRGTINFTLLKGGACDPATGLSVVAYPTLTGIAGVNRIETFSGSQLRAGLLDEPFNGSVTLNVPPLPPGESYAIYARTLEQGVGALSSQRYNFTTMSSNLIDPENQSRTFDQLATIDAISAGQSIDLGNIGILGCWAPDPCSAIDLVSDVITAPATAVKGSQITVTSSFRNQGSVASGPFEVGVYFSTDQTINTDDAFTGFTCAVPDLLPGATGTCDGLVDVPNVVPGDYYVGLLADLQNQVAENTESNNGIAAGNLTTVELNPLDPIINGSFETGDLTGWSVKELNSASNPNLPLSVHGAGVEYPAPTFLACDFITYCFYLDYFASAPTDGQYAALDDFNGDDPTTNGGRNQFVNRRELYQDIALPPGTTTLDFDYGAAWELFQYGSTQDRTFDVEIEPAGGGATLLDETILVAVNEAYEEDTDNPSGGVGDYPPASVDLSAFSGQSVRLKFVWNIPEPGTGFAFFQLDNIRLNTTPNDAPVVSVTAPANGSTFTDGDSITFAATAADTEDGDIGANLSWSSSLDGAIGSGASFATSGLSVGTHTVTASVTDAGGLSGSDAISVTVDPAPNTAPTVGITAPADLSSFTVGASVGFAGTGTDAEDGDISASLAWLSSLDGAIGSGASFATSGLSVGTHTVTASVTDAGGLSGSDAISVTVEPAPNTAPTVGITAPASGSSFTAGASVGFAGTGTDAEDGDISANLAWLSSLDGAIGSGASFATGGLSVGTHTVTASVTDAGGLSGSDAISVTVDPAPNTAPTVGITAPADLSSFTVGASVGFAGTGTDAEDGDISANLAWLSSLDGAIGSGASFATSALSVGTHTVTASVTDAGGLSGSDAISVTVDPAPNTAPTVGITAPADLSSFTVGASVGFAGTGTDAEDGDISASLAWLSSLDGAIGSGASFATSALSVGTHTVTASVTDAGGLSGSDAISVTVDPAPSSDVDNLSTSDFSTARGSVGGGTSFQDTWADDDLYEILPRSSKGATRPGVVACWSTRGRSTSLPARSTSSR